MKFLMVIIFSLLLSFIGSHLYAQWNNICQFNTYMNDIWFVDENTGYACGGQPGAGEGYELKCQLTVIFLTNTRESFVSLIM